MSRLRLAVLLGLALVIAVAGAVVLLLRGDGEDPALSTISAIGRPVEMAVPENLGPFAGDLTGEVELITERRDLRFLRLARAEGGWCYATADRRFGDWGLTEYACETAANPFPSPDVPVINVGRQQGTRDPELLEYLQFAGFAADAVDRVGIIDKNDRVIPVADVVDNVYYAPKPPPGAKRMVALNEEGEVIWRSAGVQRPEE
jgi:hypothetical protein